MPRQMLTPEQKAFNAARTGLQKVIDLHELYRDKGGGIESCTLCFRQWPCETYKFAKDALTKMKGHLSQ